MPAITSLKARLLALILPLALLPLMGFLAYSYGLAKEQIVEDRIVLYLEQIALGVTDTIKITVEEKMSDTIAIAFHSEVQQFLEAEDRARREALRPKARERLDGQVLIHEVFDLLVLFDAEGTILLTSTRDRNRPDFVLPEAALKGLVGYKLKDYGDSSWLRRIRSGERAFLDWHYSEVVHRVYDRYKNDDFAYQYNIGFAVPVYNQKGIVVGGILAFMNWWYIQEILDRVEENLEDQSLTSGYAFLFDRDNDTIIGHKYRLNRYDHSEQRVFTENNYGTRLTVDHQLLGLQNAVKTDQVHFEYEYPPGVAKISGLARVDHEAFSWVCGVGINHADIFAPVGELRNALAAAVLVVGAFIVGSTFLVARRISVPLKALTSGARRIAGGDYSERVSEDRKDEIGELARTFNDMAQSLEERSYALTELNRSLEEKVVERTQELEQSNRKVTKGYQELKETQVQLIQSEKMASLGQLVAGIAHEIKNPLNFIYGNTDFLKQYVSDLRSLIEVLEEDSAGDGDKGRIEAFKAKINYKFIVEDLDTLIDNFEEGAKRIHAIISDLRTFSRLDTDQLRAVDIREPIDLALNLMRNEFRDRIRISKELDKLPPVECDPGKISQVVMNLLVNAVHAIGGEEGEIRIRTGQDNGHLAIEIEDNGAGIRKEHLGKVFEPFFTTKPVGKGTGLGLSISYGIIRQHNGSIDVRSEVGKGTKFTVYLPLKS